jgi:hypothetical protein
MSKPRILLFVVSCVLGGMGGLLGSILGNAFGPIGLRVGGVAGGLMAALVIARLAVWRRWVDRGDYWRTAAGAGVGFLAAALVATNTLSSPIGPVLSTALVGLGAVLASRPPREAESSTAPEMHR